MTTTVSHARRRSRRLWARVWTAVVQHLAVRRSRQQLARLDDHLLRDIGLTRDEAEAEAGLPAWDAPRHWFR